MTCRTVPESLDHKDVTMIDVDILIPTVREVSKSCGRLLIGSSPIEITTVYPLRRQRSRPGLWAAGRIGIA